MGKNWTIEGLPWNRLDASKVSPDLLKLVKAAALVEYNAHAYSEFLVKIFDDDPVFRDEAREWGVEEIQHGQSLGTWAERIDPSWNLEEAMARFRTGYKLPLLDADSSLRGSKSAEMVARCMVEVGTSSYYTAIGEATDEPVLKTLAGHIAADEHRHYKLFYVNLKRCLEREKMGRFNRLRVAVARVVETDDDELAYAFYAANGENEAYDRQKFNKEYMRRAYSFYRPKHIERAMAMMFKACGFKPYSQTFDMAFQFAWWLMKSRAERLARATA